MGLSVVVACHNVADYLPACLDSLIAQQTPPDQVILVNDGSTDDTARICQEYASRPRGVDGRHRSWFGARRCPGPGT